MKCSEVSQVENRNKKQLLYNIITWMKCVAFIVLLLIASVRTHLSCCPVMVVAYHYSV